MSSRWLFSRLLSQQASSKSNVCIVLSWLNGCRIFFLIFMNHVQDLPESRMKLNHSEWIESFNELAFTIRIKFAFIILVYSDRSLYTGVCSHGMTLHSIGFNMICFNIHAIAYRTLHSLSWGLACFYSFFKHCMMIHPDTQWYISCAQWCTMIFNDAHNDTHYSMIILWLKNNMIHHESQW